MHVIVVGTSLVGWILLIGAAQLMWRVLYAAGSAMLLAQAAPQEAAH